MVLFFFNVKSDNVFFSKHRKQKGAVVPELRDFKTEIQGRHTHKNVAVSVAYKEF